MKRSQFITTIGLILPAAVYANRRRENPVSKRVGGPCEGCEAIYEYGSKNLNAADVLPDYQDAGPRMEISGTIFKRDGKTPASDVILYVYHTNQQGIYPTRGNETGWGKRHGYIRGWIKTDARGHYKFETLKPAAYPQRNDPAHIHATVKEPGVNEYWIDEYMFDDDPLLTPAKRAAEKQRCGSGIITLTTSETGSLVGRRNIILGLNIPNY